MLLTNCEHCLKRLVKRLLASRLHFVMHGTVQQGDRMRRMSTSTHGLIDYIVSGIVALLPKFGGYSKKVTTVMEASRGRPQSTAA